MTREQEEKKTKRNSILISLGVHLLVLVLFSLFGMKVFDPPPQEFGVEISMSELGTTDDGSGDVTPTKVSESVTETQTQNAQPQPVTAPTNEEVVQDNLSDVAVPAAKKPVEKPKVKPKEEPKPEKVKEEPRKVDQRSLYPGNTSDSKSSEAGGSQGSGEGVGDRGSQDGQPEGKGRLGSGNGSWELSGRSLLTGASINTTKEEGIVVLKIWVGRDGNVVRTATDLKLSNTTSQYLIDLATKAAMQTKYSSNANAPVEQIGKMTFKFILQ